MSIIIRYECDKCGKIFPKEEKEEYLQHKKLHIDYSSFKQDIVDFKKNTLTSLTDKTVSDVESFMRDNFSHIIKTIVTKEICDMSGSEEIIKLHEQFIKDIDRIDIASLNHTYTNVSGDSGSYLSINTHSNARRWPYSAPKYKLNVGDGIIINVYHAPTSPILEGVVLSILFKCGRHHNIDLEEGIFV